MQVEEEIKKNFGAFYLREELFIIVGERKNDECFLYSWKKRKCV